jgi:hypothetical protein
MDMNKYLEALKKKSALLRKALDYLHLVPRRFKRFWASPEDYQRRPPVLANSFPKSGTHLLLQILEGLPDIQRYGAFLASMPSVPFRERSQGAHLRLIDGIIPGEVVPGHLFYDPEFARALQEKHCVHYFIYRDPRDVVVSEAVYLSGMNRWHRLHRYFVRQPDLESQISLSIMGAEKEDVPYQYPNVAERFCRYQKWLQETSVFSVRFEDLTSEKQPEILLEIAQWYRNQAPGCVLDEAELARRMQANIRPEKSHTYRRGKVGGWRDVFTDVHEEQIKQVAGELLIELGYEEDMSWSI